MKVKNLSSIFFLFASLFTTNLISEPKTEREVSPIHGVSVGADIGSIAGHLTNGLRISSPAFFNDVLRIALSGHLGWAQNVMSVTNITYSWLPYGLFKLGVHAGSFMHDLPLRISSFVDLTLVTPSLKISNKAVIFGIDGGLDTELFHTANHANFIALGGMGLFPATADGLKGKPTFATGFLISFGYRYYF